jgi:ABC-type uncharacterized transport system fused permease/ATPase subunit
MITELRPVLLELPESIATLLQQLLGAKRISSFLQSRDVDYFSDEPTDNSDQPQADSLYIRGTVTWDVPKHDVGGTASDNETNTANFRLRELDVTFPRGKMTLIAGKFGSGKTLMLLALLGEARLIEGDISYAVTGLIDPKSLHDMDWSLLEGGVAYVPQVSTHSESSQVC